MPDTKAQKIAFITGFITGANRGIGLETARQLGHLGILPVIGSRTAHAGMEAVAKLVANGIVAETIVFDVADWADHQSAHDYLEQRYGRLDILITMEKRYTASTTPEDVLRDTMDTNFFAAVEVTNTLLPLIQKSDLTL